MLITKGVTCTDTPRKNHLYVVLLLIINDYCSGIACAVLQLNQTTTAQHIKRIISMTRINSDLCAKYSTFDASS